MENRLKILVVDDEQAFRELLSIILKRRGHEVTEAASGEEAMGRIMTGAYDLVLTDLRMGGMNGLALVQAIQEIPFDGSQKPECIVITGYGSIENAVDAIKNGAFSYFVKSNDPEELISSIDKIARIRSLDRENRLLKDEILSGDFMLKSDNRRFGDIIRAAEKVAATDANVLLLGESGVGKEVIAQHIHRCSARASGIFMPVNCYAFSESMIEAELYGHEKGAFTGSTGMRVGRFEAADKGTLFLDEIGEITMAIQVKLLRTIENKEIERIGSNKSIKTDFRLIAATNKDMEQAIRERQFREDLYYRINTVVFEIPPLRERKEDIPLLADYFLKKSSREMKKQVNGIADDLMRVLVQYDYPGNIRELKNIIERLLVFSDKDWITLDDLNLSRSIGRLGNMPLQSADGDNQPADDVSMATDGFRSLKSFRMKMEQAYIEKVLTHTGRDMDKAARILQISTRQLYNKLNEFNG